MSRSAHSNSPDLNKSDMRASSEGEAGRLRAQFANFVARSATNADFRPPRKIWKFVPEVICICSVRLDGATEGSRCPGLGCSAQELFSWLKILLSPVNYGRAMKNRGRLLAWLQQIELVAHGNDDVLNTSEALYAFDGRGALRGHSRQELGVV